jgi:DNA polymerase-1
LELVELVGDNRVVSDLVNVLAEGGVGQGDLVGLVVRGDGVVSVAAGGSEWEVSVADVGGADEKIRPRWVVWSQEDARGLIAGGVRIATCWDVAAVHRLLFGGWRAEPAFAWGCLHGQAADEIPAAGGEPDLFSVASDAGDAPELGAAAALESARLQLTSLNKQGGGARLRTAHSESTAELLCAELSADGLPVGRAEAEDLLTEIIGPRPRGYADAAAVKAARDRLVLRHAPDGVTTDLRSPAQVKSLLAAEGIDVPDTRAWRLEEYRDRSPLVAALLEWRKAERIATTYGYAWLDEHLGADGRLRGAWTGSDGAAGRMTASSGLHNMPAVFRRAVLAEEGHLFVRADLGQIEPRVLAAVSGDTALAAATAADDMYLPVAAELGVDRPTAKVAMIAAMYGQTTGHGGLAARRMRAAYPVAMGYLDGADRSARAGRDLRTYGGRLIRMPGGSADPQPAQAARGRYGRNAVVQGAAAELFKMWAVTVRARTAPLAAGIVLCLHDELLVHVPAEHAERAVGLVESCLTEATRRWAPNGRVRFIADISVIRSWADAKS